MRRRPRVSRPTSNRRGTFLQPRRVVYEGSKSDATHPAANIVAGTTVTIFGYGHPTPAGVRWTHAQPFKLHARRLRGSRGPALSSPACPPTPGRGRRWEASGVPLPSGGPCDSSTLEGWEPAASPDSALGLVRVRSRASGGVGWGGGTLSRPIRVCPRHEGNRILFVYETPTIASGLSPRMA
ncbi:hypothetical protein BV20DRAFT_271019 [Pilatotrama ljubarskyi]|nr:hypothetical protein BV20DRAFT_271019 [Pilatotrama ljubarskyi]